MMGSAAAVVAEVAGRRHLIGLDKGHRLEIRTAGANPVAIEGRPVTEFTAAVDGEGRLHIAAWLLSRHLMYYTSADGGAFTRSTLLKSDGGLRLKDCLITCGTAVTVVYVAETEFADTLVSYRYSGGEWEGRRIVEVEHPQRLSAFQFDGPPDGASILYAVKEPGRSVVMSRPVAGDTPPAIIATVGGGLGDFCALTVGGVQQACWIADGHLMINGLRQTEEPWSRSWPCFKREEGGVQCLWLENGLLNGASLGAQRARLRPATLKEALPCMLAMPGEVRRAIVDGQTLQEAALLPEVQERLQRSSMPPSSGRPEGQRAGQGDLTLTDVVRNQAVYLTRMQDSLGAVERNMLRLQSEVNRLTREVAALLREKAANERAPAFVRAAGIQFGNPPENEESGAQPDIGAEIGIMTMAEEEPAVQANGNEADEQPMPVEEHRDSASEPVTDGANPTEEQAAT